MKYFTGGATVGLLFGIQMTALECKHLLQAILRVLVLS
jgi:hypothetical protein